jgi:hypothetical protein
MGNKESQFDDRSDVRESQTLDSSLIRSFTEVADGDTEFTLDRFQVISFFALRSSEQSMQ